MSAFLQPRKLLVLLTLLTAIITNAQKSVLTQHNDLNRTGWYDNETILNKSNVRPGSFGKIFVRSVDDQIYAQPLVKLKLDIPGKGKKNVVFVATVNNTVYAFDADSANINTAYWQVNLTPPHSRVINKRDATGACGGFYNDFSGNMGIVGTPVIDSTTNSIYVVARSVDTIGGTNTFRQYLHALDITTGAEKVNSPVLITATIDGTGDGSSGGKLSFNLLHQNQRPGLLLVNGTVYIGWSSHCDWGPYHGWVIGYDKTTLQQKYIYNSTPDGYNGGIWMSGSAPSADENGNIYLAVGNGSVGKNGNISDLRNRSESALKLTSSLSISSFFTPANYLQLEGADLDFGVTEIMLLPGTDLAMVGCKDGHIYVLNRNNMGGYNSTTNDVVQTINLGSNANLRSSFAYYKGAPKEFAYSWSENSLLNAYPFNRTTNSFDLGNTISSGVQGPTGNNGALLSVSSTGSVDSTAILWTSYAATGDANQSVRPGILRAFDATDVTKELWNSGISLTDNPGNYAKFNCPTIVNGKVYLATFSNQLVVYGLTGSNVDTCGTSNVAVNKPAYASSVEGAGYEAYKAFDGNLTTRWSSEFSDPQYIYVDLGKNYDICRVNLRWETALGQNFKIQVSENASSWTDVAGIANNVSYDNYIPVKATGRYVRMYGTIRGTPYGYSLYEFEVYGKENNGCAIPAELYTSDVYENAATLHWNANGAASYIIQYKNVDAGSWLQTVSATNSIVITGLACGTSYLYRIQAVCSSQDSSNYSSSAAFTTLSCNSNCNPLPTRWSTLDIGNVSIAGSACYDNGVFEIKGSGTDIWDTEDEFRFAYKTLVGDGEIYARVLDQDATNEWNKVGIMARESLTAGSRHAFIALTSGNGVAFQDRTITDGYSDNANTGPGINAPYWLKLKITGTTYTGYASPDGFNWTQIGSPVNTGFGNGVPIYAGLAITSHDNAVLSTAHIDNYTLSGALPVELISFTGSLGLDQTVSLQWVTTLENNAKNFVVERSGDNIYFRDIDTVAAVNSGRFTVTYQSTDKLPLHGINYYRLRIVDADDRLSYSPIVMIRVTSTKSPLVYPNPANNTVHIVQGAELVKFVNMYDVTGKIIVRVPNATSQTVINIPVATLSNGLYFVEIVTTNSVFREKLVIHK